MKGEAYNVYHGGLLRCCLASLDEFLFETTEPTKEGDTHECKYCHSRDGNMIYQGGGWRWNNPTNVAGEGTK